MIMIEFIKQSIIRKNYFSPTNDRQNSIGRITIISDAHSFGAQRNGYRWISS